MPTSNLLPLLLEASTRGRWSISLLRLLPSLSFFLSLPLLLLLLLLLLHLLLHLCHLLFLLLRHRKLRRTDFTPVTIGKSHRNPSWNSFVPRGRYVEPSSSGTKRNVQEDDEE